jgi:ComF family protein
MFVPAALRLARAALDGVLAVVVAPRCAACASLLEAPLDGPVCPACWASIRPLTDPVCDRCGDPLASANTGLKPCVAGGEPLLCRACATSDRAIDRGRAVGEYEGALREIVHALKYDHRRSIAVRLGAMMRSRGRVLLAGADFAVPVPLHRRRRRQRGFNQADDLARQLGLPVRRILVRCRATKPQADLPASARRANVRGAFGIRRRPAVRRRRQEDRLAGMSLVLVDDVSTTGATLEACARVLKEAGAREVRALTAARVVSRRP